MQPDSDKQTFVVAATLEGRRLDGALRTVASLSWGDARSLIERGKVSVGGVVTTAAEQRVHGGDTIEIDPRAPKRKDTGGLTRSAIVYLDPHLVVVEKPAGISTVPYEQGERGTLDQLVAALLPRKHGRGPPTSLGIVQRLDKETSGLIVFSRTVAAKKAIASQLRAHTVHRRYLALAHGRVNAAVLRSYLVKDRGDGLRGTSRFGKEGQLAITHIDPIEVLDRASLVSCKLETGRTHQIRIHLAEAGHPVVGERVYVRNYRAELIAAPRPMLHAIELGFTHPVKGNFMKFESRLPEDFSAMLTRLRAR